MDPYREFSIGVFPNSPLPCLEAGQDVEAKLWFDGPVVLPPPFSGFGALGLNLGSLQDKTSEKFSGNRWEHGVGLSQSQIVCVAADSATQQHTKRHGRAFFGDSSSEIQRLLLNWLFAG